jgi:tRNA(His) 5'-end guanylyltransferase
LLGDVGVFELPHQPASGAELVRDYCRWRNEDAQSERAQRARLLDAAPARRNRRAGDQQAARHERGGQERAPLQGGINFNDLPACMKRGVGLYWETYEKESQDPRSGRLVRAIRRPVEARF